MSALGAKAAGRGGPRARNLGVWIGTGIATAALIGAAATVAVTRSRCCRSFVATAKGGVRVRRIAASTAQKALTHLKAEGLIRTEVGLGSFVADGAS
ncbi:hypothetical protein [Streptomyces sp900116325]|uniref:hypothetical protein n=1 Tax=Streptomyces sp. 900116325 TaxID=3154295 RepID=UPI003326109B